jgi:hypothetical protein
MSENRGRAASSVETLEDLPVELRESLIALGVEDPGDVNDLEESHITELRAGLKPAHQGKLDRFVQRHKEEYAPVMELAAPVANKPMKRQQSRLSMYISPIAKNLSNQEFVLGNCYIFLVAIVPLSMYCFIFSGMMQGELVYKELHKHEIVATWMFRGGAVVLFVCYVLDYGHWQNKGRKRAIIMLATLGVVIGMILNTKNFPSTPMVIYIVCAPLFFSVIQKVPPVKYMKPRQFLERLSLFMMISAVIWTGIWAAWVIENPWRKTNGEWFFGGVQLQYRTTLSCDTPLSEAANGICRYAMTECAHSDGMCLETTECAQPDTQICLQEYDGAAVGLPTSCDLGSLVSSDASATRQWTKTDVQKHYTKESCTASYLLWVCPFLGAGACVLASITAATFARMAKNGKFSALKGLAVITGIPC